MAKELWDIRDAEGNPTGRVIERGMPLEEGEYMLAVHIYIVNYDHKIIFPQKLC